MESCSLSDVRALHSILLTAKIFCRAHRVGQTREVEIVRLVSKNTIEEQIHALGETKLALDERVAGTVDADMDNAKIEKQGQKAVENIILGIFDKEAKQ